VLCARRRFREVVHVLKGDLSSTSIAEVLRQLADGDATGCLHVTDPAGEVAKTYLRGGRVYAVLAPGRRPQLGSRLVSSGALAPEALAEALEAQRTELQGWRLGELLVHLGYVDQPVVEDFVNEQVRASLSDLLPWRHATWKFRVNERTREDVAPPVPVAELLAEIDARLDEQAEMQEVVGGPDAVPLLSAGDTAGSETEIDADAWSLLCKVDGVRTITELARECGFTLYEAGRVVSTLVAAGLLEVEEPEEVVDAASFLAEAASTSELAPADVASRLASALSAPPVPVQRETTTRALPHSSDSAQVDGSVSRVSEALAALLGPATASDDVFGAPTHRPSSAPPPPPVDPKKAERERLAALRRAADAGELAAAQADLEAARAASEASFAAEHGEDHVAEVVDLQLVRAAAEAAEEAREAARLEEEQLAAHALEQARLMAEAAEAARLEEERLAAEAAEQARLDEEQLAAEAAEQARLEEEALRAEEQQRAAEAAEQARLDEEARLAADAAEQARLDEEARLEEEARLAADAAEQARLDEEARLATEVAEQLRAQEEADAAEQARLEEESRTAAEAAEQARHEEEAHLAEQARLDEEHRAAEEHRLAAEAAEEVRLQHEAQQAADAAERARLEEEVRLEEEARLAEEHRLAAEDAEQARLEEQTQHAAEAAEQARLAELARLEEQAMLEEEARREEEIRTAEEQRLAAEAAAEQARLDMEAHTAEEQARLAEAAASEFAALTADFDDHPVPSVDHETQAAAFAELSASAAVTVAEPAQAAAPVMELDDEPMPSYHQDTDTAALMRELSSLGLDDDPPPPPPTRPARPATPRPVAAPAKKKKGLFGRG